MPSKMKYQIRMCKEPVDHYLWIPKLFESKEAAVQYAMELMIGQSNSGFVIHRVDKLLRGKYDGKISG